MDHKKNIFIFINLLIAFSINAFGYDPYYNNPNPLTLNTGANSLYNPSSFGGCSNMAQVSAYQGGYMVGMGMYPQQANPCWGAPPTLLPSYSYQPGLGATLLGALAPALGGALQSKWDKPSKWRSSGEEYTFESTRGRIRERGTGANYEFDSSLPDASVTVTMGPAGHDSQPEPVPVVIPTLEIDEEVSPVVEEIILPDIAVEPDYSDEDTAMGVPVLKPTPKFNFEDEDTAMGIPVLKPAPKFNFEDEDTAMGIPVLKPAPKFNFEDEDIAMGVPVVQPTANISFEDEDTAMGVPVVKPTPSFNFEDEDLAMGVPVLKEEAPEVQTDVDGLQGPTLGSEVAPSFSSKIDSEIVTSKVPPQLPQIPELNSDSLPVIPEDVAVEVAVETVDDVNNTLQELLRPSHEACAIFKDNSLSKNDAVIGAMRVMANFYQDCSVLDQILDENYTIPDLGVTETPNENRISIRELKAEDEEFYINNHPYLKIVKENKESQETPNEQCVNVLENPPIFSYGAKSRIDNRNNNIDILRNQAHEDICKYSNVACDSNPVTSLDCSGFIQASLWAQGLKFYSNGSYQSNTRQINTSNIIDIARDKNSCLEVTDFEASDDNKVQTIKEGDIISLSRHHTFMIGTTGEDPLGVNRVLKAGKSVDDCNKINRDHFDFTIFQSGSFQNIGVSHVHVRSANTELQGNGAGRISSSILTQMEYKAQSICEKAMTKKLAKESMSGLKESTESEVKTGRSSNVFSIIRHKADDPTCKKDPVELKNESCVKGCLEKRLN
jgi:hypothetical protein